MKLPKVYIHVMRDQKQHPIRYYMHIVGLDSKLTKHEFTQGATNCMSKFVITSLREQSSFYASIKEPTWKLIEFLDKNYSKCVFKMGDNTTTKDLGKGCYHIFRSLESIFIADKTIRLDIFSKNEKFLIQYVYNQLNEKHRDVLISQERQEISDLVDKLNEMDSDDYRPE